MTVSEPVVITESPVKMDVSEMQVVAAAVVLEVVLAVAVSTGRDRASDGCVTAVLAVAVAVAEGPVAVTVSEMLAVTESPVKVTVSEMLVVAETVVLAVMAAVGDGPEP